MTRLEGVGDYKQVKNHTSPTPSNLFNTYLISDPNLTLTPKNLYFINWFEGVGEERLMTRGCVLTFLWGRLHREKKD